MDFSFKVPEELTDDRVYLLDAQDVLNPDYGYYNASGYLSWSSNPYTYESVINHEKEGGDYWWLRSEATDPVDEFAGGISVGGEYSGGFSGKKIEVDWGVAPAINIKQSSVIFTTEIVAPDADGYNGEYKLTVLDESIDYHKVGDKDAYWSSETGAFLEVPYDSDSSVTTYSLPILDDEKTTERLFLMVQRTQHSRSNRQVLWITVSRISSMLPLMVQSLPVMLNTLSQREARSSLSRLHILRL